MPGRPSLEAGPRLGGDEGGEAGLVWRRALERRGGSRQRARLLLRVRRPARCLRRREVGRRVPLAHGLGAAVVALLEGEVAEVLLRPVHDGVEGGGDGGRKALDPLLLDQHVDADQLVDLDGGVGVGEEGDGAAGGWCGRGV